MKIKVTPEHVALALENKENCISGGCCPIFQAFSEAFGTKDVYAGISSVRVNATSYRLPRPIIEAVEHFCFSHEWTLFGEFDIEEEMVWT